MRKRKISRILGVALSAVMLAGCFVPVPGFAEGQTDAGSAESQIQAAQADENAAESQLNNEKTAETAQAPAAASETAEADADATGDEEADASEESAATEGDESANESTIADAAAPVIRRVQGVSSLTGTAYAVFNSESGELDFVRSTESHSNGDTGTVTSISGGTYTGTIYTGFEDSAAVYNHQQAPWHGANVKKVDFVDKISPYYTAAWFDGFSNCASVDNLLNLDTSNVKNMNYMFFGCKSLTDLDLSGFDTSNVQGMLDMFSWCSGLTELNLSSFDTSNVENMAEMFDQCTELTSVRFGDKFNTSKVTDMSHMFAFCAKLTDLDVSGFDTAKAENMTGMFRGCKSLTSLNVNNFDTSSVTDMNNMFADCSALTALDVSGFKTSNVTNMSAMFSGCSNITSLDVSGFDTAKVTNMASMFSGCSKLTSPLDVSGFDTSGVTNMSFMFNGCENLPSLDVSGFNTSSVTNMSYMFCTCKKLASLNVSKFDTAKVTNMGAMFSNCQSLESLDVSGFDTSNVTSMKYMFTACLKLSEIDVSKFNTSKVTNMEAMFSSCQDLESLDLSGFDTSNVTSMKYMFTACLKLPKIDVSKFNTSKATNMEYMFSSCSGLSSLDLRSFDTSKVTTTSNMFLSCTNLNQITFSDKFTVPATHKTMFSAPSTTASGKVSTGNWGLGSEKADTTYSADALADYGAEKAGNLAGTWYAQKDQRTAYAVLTAAGELDFIRSTGTYTNGSTGTVTSISGSTYTGTIYTGFEENTTAYSYKGAPWYSKCSDIKTVKFVDTVAPNFTAYWFSDFSNCTSMDLKNLDTAEAANMAGMFQNCSGLASIDVSGFTTSKVTNMASMFHGCNELTSLDLSNFNTENVTNMSNMFWYCSSLTSLNISGLDTSSVTNMSGMFEYCEKLSSLDVSTFNTANVTDMSYMFLWCTNLKSIDVSSFDTAKVTTMQAMFSSCSNLNEMKFGDLFKIPTQKHFQMFPTPTTTASGKASTGEWGFESEKADTTYSATELANYGAAAAGKLSGTWFAQAESQETAYAVFVSGSDGNGELDFVRSKETYTNGSTGTVTSISGGTYEGTIYTGFEESQTTSAPLWNSILTKVTSVKFVDTITPHATAQWFSGMTSCTSMDLKKLDTSSVTNMSYMFSNCNKLTSLDVSDFNTSKVTTMEAMFSNCKGLESLNISNFDTSDVTNMYCMFTACQKLSEIDLSNFNTAKVTNMKYLFSSCSKLNKVTFSENFAVPATHTTMFPTPTTTASGAKATGKWGLGSETAETTYLAADLADYGAEVAGNLKGTWYSQTTPIMLTFDANGGSGTMEPENITNKKSITAPACTFTRDGYVFDSWNTNATGTGTKYSEGDTVPISGNITLYAQWKSEQWSDSKGVEHEDGTFVVRIPKAISYTGKEAGTVSTSDEYDITVEGSIESGKSITVKAESGNAVTGSNLIGSIVEKTLLKDSTAGGSAGEYSSTNYHVFTSAQASQKTGNLVTGTTVKDIISMSGTVRSAGSYTGSVQYTAALIR